ncbi:hypothetical protein GUITHDRAFT_116160 [Guillardia theta CCMP2712]|uniref:Uncharacterized protein n=1 Tax=Guillardia theta (strain CCMP2712) TaxID=905079 RepID=L1IN42_GUITC|nr:hypothetical protein GUITHDRAFT_116160 [Guillardia theta CCMP2712]EKX37683.1 hypothetical protein GUITHDRAFT_116160 [Guillardia theta CCMP2712]|eukprot:XP_005824663.1 hypothetical protein GUITHDRAFT_116160 [Guillardia theta CCMP2712]
MLHHILIPHHHALANGDPPGEPQFNAAGYNSGSGIYAWKGGAWEDWSGQANRVYCKSWDKYFRQQGYVKPGELSQWDPTCRGFDVNYNEWHNLDDSASPFKSNTTPVDPGSVDSWLSNVGGGIYRGRPTTLRAVQHVLLGSVLSLGGVCVRMRLYDACCNKKRSKTLMCNSKQRMGLDVQVESFVLAVVLSQARIENVDKRGLPDDAGGDELHSQTRRLRNVAMRKKGQAQRSRKGM